MRILFLSRWYPFPANNGSRLRIYNLIRGLSKCHDVVLLSFFDPDDGAVDLASMQALCSKVCIVPWKPFEPSSLKSRLGFFSPTPRSLVDIYSPQMKQSIAETLAATSFDVIIASQFDMAVYAPGFQNVPALFEELEIGTYLDKATQPSALRHRLRPGLTWYKHRRFLNSLLPYFQSTTVVSSKERQSLHQAMNGYNAIDVIPNGVDVSLYSSIPRDPKPNTLIFTGAFSYHPNYEAMQWFLGEVYPHIQAQVPDVHLLITGKHGNLPLPTMENVTLTGFVDDIRPLIAGAWASIVPLHTGGGTRLKILEAMALGTPVVATSKGAEGLEAEVGTHLLVADTPEDFAQTIIRLFQEPNLRQTLADNAYQLIKEKYDWDVLLPQFLQLVDKITN